MAARLTRGGSHQGSLFASGLAHPPSARLSPKRPLNETAGLADVFPYYAGFSYEWACKALNSAKNADSNHVVLDPWNGSGTTTLAARTVGLPSIGIDLNPVANIVARLRAEAARCTTMIEPPAGESASEIIDDPLLAWFAPISAARFRAWATKLLAMPLQTSTLGIVATFRVVRAVTKHFQGSNPTWVRRISIDRPAVEIAPGEIDSLIIAEQQKLRSRAEQEDAGNSPLLLITGSANQLPLQDNSIDIVLTSPPYLTRIDYAVAYARELALLGTDITTERKLREKLMGTTLIRPADSRLNGGYGPEAQKLVDNVAQHASKASSGYYFKQVCQYLDDLTSSLDEITRVCSPGAKAILVVQDSYYKDVPIKLHTICADEASKRGWEVVDTDSEEVTRILTSRNKAAQAYPKGPVSETIVELRLP